MGGKRSKLHKLHIAVYKFSFSTIVFLFCFLFGLVLFFDMTKNRTQNVGKDRESSNVTAKRKFKKRHLWLLGGNLKTA